MTDQLPIAMPSDDELYHSFVEAIRNGVAENIRWIADKLSGFIENAKDDLKWLINVDPTDWLQLAMDLAKGDQILASFVSKQNRLMRNTLKLLLSSQWASTFTEFVAKMKADPASAQHTIDNLSKIMTIFFADLGHKYLTKETDVTIKEKISNLFK